MGMSKVEGLSAAKSLKVPADFAAVPETFKYALCGFFIMAVEKHVPEAAATTSYIQYKGVWDMQDLYEFLAGFFSKRKFKFYELRYITKFPGPFGPETYFIWQATPLLTSLILSVPVAYWTARSVPERCKAWI